MPDLFYDLRSNGIDFEPDAMLSRFSSFRIGGACDIFILPKSEDELKYTLSLLNTAGVKPLVVGNMSNILFSDSGFRGAVVTTKMMSKITVDDNVVTAEAGASLTSLSELCREKELSGAEFLYGIPGTIGGGVYMNAGAFGSSVSDILVSSRREKDGDISTITKEEHEFSYRKSIYGTVGGTLLSAKFRFLYGDRKEISEKMSANAAKRRASQPLDKPSAGSVFKRPEGHFAGKLIEDAGLKGMRVGGAEVSLKHAGFIVNTGGATADDVKQLIGIIKNRVYELSGVTLEEEIIIQP